MVFSELLLKIPYCFWWKLVHDRNDKNIYFYVGEYIDYEVMKNIVSHLKMNVFWVAKNKKIQKKLKDRDVEAKLYPVFPKYVLMARHATHKFPCKSIVKFGMRHGAYHFKSMIDAKKYNKFDLFFMTSSQEVKEAQELGIRCAVNGGFPKLDSLFQKDFQKIIDGWETQHSILDFHKPIIFFSATWEKSGLSGYSVWKDQLHRLTKQWNVVVSLHPFYSEVEKNRFRHDESIIFAEEWETSNYIFLADVTVSDTSSIIAEFCALQKPIITFDINLGYRFEQKIQDMIRDISFSVSSFSQLEALLHRSTSYLLSKAQKQESCNDVLIHKLNGKHGEMIAQNIEMRIYDSHDLLQA